MRVHVDYITTSRKVYEDFCREYPEVHLPYETWKSILYSFNEEFRNYILETGAKVRFLQGFGEFTINKKKRGKTKVTPDGVEYPNMAVDWKKTKEKGKIIYNMNYHTDGYFFGWMWFKSTARFKQSNFWYFKPARITSRLINHYLKTSKEYQGLYLEWKK